MFDTDKPEERGQVGIGTLIVFIALVLVAAIAAGVLINTAGFLQSQAESTGQESTDQVSNQLDVQLITAKATADVTTDPVFAADSLEVDIQLSPGANAIDPDGLELTVFEEGAGRTSLSASNGDFVVNNENGTDILGNSDVIEENSVYTITNLGVLGSADQTGNNFTIIIETSDGVVIETQFSMPDVAQNDETYIV